MITEGEKRMIRIYALILAMALAAGPLVRAQSAATEQSLKATNEALLAAIKSGNIEMAQALIHPRAVGFFRESQRIAELSAGYTAADALPSVLADIGRFNAVTYSATYRVIGDTGVVCMANNMQAKKWEKAGDRFTRSTYVYVSVNGSWRLLSWHTSDIPLK